MANCKFGPNYELNRFTGNLTYRLRRFIFYATAQRGVGAWHNGPPKYATAHRSP